MTGPRIAGTLPVGKAGLRECARVTRCARMHQKLEILAAHSLTRLTTELERTLAVSDAFHEFHHRLTMGAQSGIGGPCPGTTVACIGGPKRGSSATGTTASATARPGSARASAMRARS